MGDANVRPGSQQLTCVDVVELNIQDDACTPPQSPTDVDQTSNPHTGGL